MGKKLTVEEFQNRVDKIFNGSIDLSEFNFVNTSTPGHCKCKICGHEWDPKGNTLLNGHGCRKCYDKRNSAKRIISLEEIQQRIDENNKGVKIIGDYVDTKHRCTAKCMKCGHEWHPVVRDIIDGSGCPKCYDSWTFKRKTREQFIKEMKELYNNEYEYVIDNEYVTTQDFISFICPRHGLVPQLAATHMKGNGCKFCKESGLEKQTKIKLN